MYFLAAFTLLLQISASAASPTLHQKGKLDVDLFYESQCPYSLEFLNTTLREAHADKGFWKKLSVRLHPFGNARLYKSNDLSPGYHFWHPDTQYPKIMCQHSDVECLGNKIQACTIALHPDPDDHVPFILCMASYGLQAGVELTSYACGQKLDIDMKAVKECVSSPKAHDMMMTIGKTTHAAQVTHVPWVTLANEHTKDDAFFTPICDSLAECNANGVCGEMPKICDKYDKKKTVGKVHEKNEHCGGSGSFLARDSKVTPCERRESRKTEVAHITAAGPKILL